MKQGDLSQWNNIEACKIFSFSHSLLMSCCLTIQFHPIEYLL